MDVQGYNNKTCEVYLYYYVGYSNIQINNIYSGHFFASILET